MSDAQKEAQLKEHMKESVSQSAVGEDKKQFLKNFFDEEEEAEKAELAKTSPKPKRGGAAASRRPGTTGGRTRKSYKQPTPSPIKAVAQSKSNPSLRRGPRTSGSGSGSRLYDRRPNTSQSKRGRPRRPSFKVKQPGPINMDIINRLSKPRKKKQGTDLVVHWPRSLL